MSDGKTHDRIGLQVAFPYSLALCLIFYPRFGYVALGLASYLFSIGFFSPDLDLKSTPFKRWGILRWYWLPYQKRVKHRSSSHTPVIGTISRLSYLLAPLLVAALLLMLVYGIEVIRPIGQLAITYRTSIFVILSGLELGALVHIGLDHLPKPRRKR